MLARSGIAKGGYAGGLGSGVAKRADAHAVLLNALADKENSYRRWMRPADIIAQNMSERPKPKPVARSPGFAELLWKFLRREFKRRMPSGLPRVRLFAALRRKAEALFHSKELHNQDSTAENIDACASS
jgi:hypothetical protein